MIYVNIFFILASLNGCYQSVAHVSALNIEWVLDMIKYFNDIYQSEEYKKFYNLYFIYYFIERMGMVI